MSVLAGREKPSCSPSILFLSTYPPTRCGIANYTHSLVEALEAGRGSSQGLAVARLLGAYDRPCVDRTVETFVTVDEPTWPQAVARTAQRFDLLWIQHEFGIFDDAGESILRLAQWTDTPIVTTLHTVLREPDPNQRGAVDILLHRSERTVVMSEHARHLLIDNYLADPRRVVVIPHGVHSSGENGRASEAAGNVFTWGLLGPGKGIERGIAAIARLGHLRPPPSYLIAGATHPNVLRAEGDAYRLGLERLIEALGVEDRVTIHDGYLSDEALAQKLAEADVVLLPYDSTEQVTSGVLVEALGAGVPVVATAFPHAVELLSGGAGLVVPHGDVRALGAALERLLSDPAILQRARRAASQVGGGLRWSEIARLSEALAVSVTESVGGPEVIQPVAAVR